MTESSTVNKDLQERVLAEITTYCNNRYDDAADEAISQHCALLDENIARIMSGPKPHHTLKEVNEVLQANLRARLISVITSGTGITSETAEALADDILET